MMYFVTSIYSNNCECHAFTTSDSIQQVQTMILQQLLYNQMLDRVRVETVYIENDTIVRSVLFDKNKEDVEMED